MYDTSRHFIAFKHVLRALAAMEFNKLNVLHWHLTDDHSLSIETDSFKNYEDITYYREDSFYSKDEVRQIIEFARIRGIAIMPEIETPGHVQSMTHAMKERISQ